MAKAYQAVVELQRQLNRFPGISIGVDGVLGTETRGAYARAAGQAYNADQIGIVESLASAATALLITNDNALTYAGRTQAWGDNMSLTSAKDAPVIGTSNNSGGSSGYSSSTPITVPSTSIIDDVMNITFIGLPLPVLVGAGVLGYFVYKKKFAKGSKQGKRRR